MKWLMHYFNNWAVIKFRRDWDVIVITEIETCNEFLEFSGAKAIKQSKVSKIIHWA